MIGYRRFALLARTSAHAGHWNTVSVMIANAITEPNCRPATVMTEPGILQRMPKWMARVSAARTGEADIVGAQHFQHLGAHQRMISVIWKRPSVIDGMISLQPGDGEEPVSPADPHHVAAPERRHQPSVTANNRSAIYRSGRSARICRSATPPGRFGEQGIALERRINAHQDANTMARMWRPSQVPASPHPFHQEVRDRLAEL